MQRSSATLTTKPLACSGGLSRVAIALYLSVYLVAAEPLTGWLWARGAHPTPEHWAQHLFLDAVGVAHHHGDVDDGETVSVAESTLSLLAGFEWVTLLPTQALPGGIPWLFY